MSASDNLSHQQLALWMTPEEIKGHGVWNAEMQDEDEGSEEKFWDRKKEESSEWTNHGFNDNPYDLAADIHKNGVKEPVDFNVDMQKLTDGHHRVASAKPGSLIPVEYHEN